MDMMLSLKVLIAFGHFRAKFNRITCMNGEPSDTSLRSDEETEREGQSSPTFDLR